MAEKFEFLYDNGDGGYGIKIVMRDPVGPVGYCRE